MFGDLTQNNYTMYAIQNYSNNHCLDMNDFYKDMNHFKKIEKLLKKFMNNDVFNMNLCINHFLILFNLFHHDSVVNISFLTFDETLRGCLSSIFSYLNYLPEISTREINGEYIHFASILTDKTMDKLLEKI